MPSPNERLRLQLDEVEGDLKDPRRFGDALAILQTQDFQKRDIKRVFNAYSDNSECEACTVCCRSQQLVVGAN